MTKKTKSNNFYLDHLLENIVRVDAGLQMLHPEKKGATESKKNPVKKQSYAKGEINIDINMLPEYQRLKFFLDKKPKLISKTSKGLNYIMGFDDE